jgi:predicted glycosyltransferase
MSTILLIEDEPVLARNMATALGRAGFETVHAASAKEARDAISERRFGLVIADISLGDGDGIDVLTEYGDALADVPVIVMTGQDCTTNRLRAERIAVAAFLAKPFAMARLCELAGALMSDRRGAGRRSRGPSVVMYSHDTIGLGHMRRNAAIAEELVARVPGISVLMVVGCPAGMIFEPKPGVDFIKLPSLAKLGRDRWQSGSLRIDADMVQALRAGILERVMETFEPDLLLVDHEPTGVWDELREPLRAMRARPGTRTILGLRDILDDPERTLGSWRNSGTDRAIADLYDDVLIYGNSGFYPSHSAYGLDVLRPGHVHYCGAVTTIRRRGLRARSGRPAHVLVSGGGGRDAFALLDTALEALAMIPRRKRPQATIIAGPLMDAELRTVLHRRAADIGAELHDQVNDMPARLAATDLFLTMGGYNSVTEALAVGCPFIVVPRVGPSSEQRLRAARLHDLGLARVIERPELTPARLAQHITAPLPHPSAPPVALDFDGAARAAEFLAALIEDSRTGSASRDRAQPYAQFAAQFSEQVSHG